MLYYLTAQGQRDLLERKRRLADREVQLRKLRRTVDRRSVGTDRDDAREPDNHENEEFVHLQQTLQIDAIIANAVVAEEPTDVERLRVGNLATVQRRDQNDNPIGKPERYRVVGYQETDLKTNPPSLSYDSPLLAQLMGRRVDPNRDPAKVVIGGKSIGVELIEIDLDTSKKLKAANAA